MIDLTGAEQIANFIQQLDLEMAAMDRQISAEFEAWTKRIFKDIVVGTPQFSGNLATAWNYSIGEPNSAYAPIPSKGDWKKARKAEIHVRGDDPAVSEALAKAEGVHPGWRDVVWIHNPAPYATLVENQGVTLRAVNLVDGRVAMVQYAVDKYNTGGYGV